MTYSKHTKQLGTNLGRQDSLYHSLAHARCMPLEDYPDRLPKERRFFHYFHIARKLGVKGAANRAKLPACVREKIAEMYPDTEGEATNEGRLEAV